MADAVATGDVLLKVGGFVAGLFATGGIGYGAARWVAGVFTKIQQDGIDARKEFGALHKASLAAQDAAERRHEDRLEAQRDADAKQHEATMQTLRAIEENCAKKFEESQKAMHAFAEENRRVILKMAGFTESGSFPAVKPSQVKKGPPRSRPGDEADAEDTDGEVTA